MPAGQEGPGPAGCPAGASRHPVWGFSSPVRAAVCNVLPFWLLEQLKHTGQEVFVIGRMDKDEEQVSGGRLPLFPKEP